MLQFPAPGCGGTQSTAHVSRVAALAARLKSVLDDDETASEVLEVCQAFDQAVEFAAFEGITVREAIRDFASGESLGIPLRVRKALSAITGGAAVALRPVSLPVIPQTAARVLRTSDETSSPAEIQQIAGSDPVLCGRLLQAANSARFGGRQTVTRVIDAAARLGVPLARKVLLSACFAPLFASKSLQNLWKHSREVAATASEAARLVGFDGDVAYTAGLLHDIGRLIFETGHAAARIELDRWLAAGLPLTYAETLVYGQDHAEAGGRLLLDWAIPDTIVEAVEFHHQPERSRSVAGALLFIAEETCATNGVSESLSPGLRRAHAERTSGLKVETLSSALSAPDLLLLAG